MKNSLVGFRKIFDISQNQLAKDLSVSRQTIISIENGRNNPSLVLAFKIAKKFNCSIETVFHYEDD
ncbi:helix-turn-helix transcriptional regulator [Sutcliffiella horikoshii]|uniref:helix-turn-helix transcriptional regulator n=1 Tax=Sutcliffiella horikoshii TaxID=79883 RepID=UPI003CF5807C